MQNKVAFNKAFDKAIEYGQQGRLEDASMAWTLAAKLSPNRPDVQYNLANVLKNLGKNEAAIEAYNRCIDIEPGFTNAHFNLGGVLKSMGRLAEAAFAFRGAISSDSNDSEAHVNLGNTLDLLGDKIGAEKSLKQAIALNPNSALAHYNLANILEKIGRSNEAISQYRQAIDISPNLINAHINLGNILIEHGNFNEAISAFTQAIELDPNNVENHINLADLFRRTNYLNESHVSCLRALELNPNSAEAHCILGNIYQAQGLIQSAHNSFQQAIALKKDFYEAHCNLGNALKDLRDLCGAIKAYEKAMQFSEGNRKHQSDVALRNYLLIQLYKPQLSNNQLFKCYRSNISSKRDKLSATIPEKKPEKFRIGYISSDFRSHPVGNNIASLLTNHDHKRVEVFCYDQVVVRDNISKEFYKHADHWRIINNKTDKDVAEMMQADKIHIAVFLGGHFDENRPEISNYRAAPIQIAMHGGTTTALEAMDYWLSDDVLHPKGEHNKAEKFTETIWRLPNFYNFPIPTNAPDVSPLPATSNGYVTFISFNRPCKINNAVINLWSGVLSAVPKSKLIIKYYNHFSEAAVADPIREQFTANGIDNSRVELTYKGSEFYEHLTDYHMGDIALDTFPFSGATTTFQALWMGLPVISLRGDRFISRMGESICKHVGLNDLCASTPEKYIKICASLANNLEYLIDLRQDLRNLVASSALCDGISYARNFEDALDSIWREKHIKD